MRHQILTLTTLILLLGGCSSVPETIREAPPDAPPLQVVRQAPPEAYLGAQVRWGGTISRTENLQDKTRIEIVARSLYNDGEPKQVDTSAGRFLAVIGGFLDPAIYATGRRLTIVGEITGHKERKLGDMTYSYPVVKVKAHYLWPPPIERDDPYGPRHYDPWYPWHRYPYY